MVLEHTILPIGQWLASYLGVFLILIVTLGFLGILIAFLREALQSGPEEAYRSTTRGLGRAWVDLGALSLRRIGALARVAIKEAIRSYVLVVPAAFLLILAFAGWFLGVKAENPVRLYISFVLKLTSFLSILTAVLLTVFSIPNDIKQKTIFTVVTKPVRIWEVLLGRIVGFGLVGTFVIATMGIVGYLWVLGAIAHRHEVEPESIRWDSASGLVSGRTTFDSGHRHEFTVSAENGGQTLGVFGHYHTVTVGGTPDAPVVSVSGPRGALQSRVPVYGKVTYLDRDGQPKVGGINVGKEWTYRGYIEGGTLCAGIFRFENLRSTDFRQGLPLEMTIRVFRTYKGEIERGIRGTMFLRNPAVNDPTAWEEARKDADVARESEPITFFASDMSSESLLIPRRIEARMPDDTTREVDIFESLVHNDSLEIVVQCDERAQYFGMAPTDLYLRAADRAFTFNYVKTCVTQWLRMMIVTGFGVMFSSLLAGPVAMLATIAILILGYFSQNVFELAIGKTVGGGPIEATIRMFRQDNLVTPLDVGPILQAIIQGIDRVLLGILQAVSSIMPNFGDFSERGGMETTRFVASGFDIPGDLMWQHVLTALAYVAVCTAVGYFLLKAKEVAA